MESAGDTLSADRLANSRALHPLLVPQISARHDRASLSKADVLEYCEILLIELECREVHLWSRWTKIQRLYRAGGFLSDAVGASQLGSTLSLLL